MSSFHNTQPRTREERLAARDKELLEKGRLKNRYSHGQTAAGGMGSPVVPESSSPMFEPNCFQRDVAGLIKQQKQQAISKQQVCTIEQDMHDQKPATRAAAAAPKIAVADR